MHVLSFLLQLVLLLDHVRALDLLLVGVLGLLLLVLDVALPGQLPHVVVAHASQGGLVFELAVDLDFLLMKPLLVVDVVFVLLAHHVPMPLLLDFHLILVVHIALVVGCHQALVHVFLGVHVALPLLVVVADYLLELVVYVMLHPMQLLLLHLIQLSLHLQVLALAHMVV